MATTSNKSSDGNRLEKVTVIGSGNWGSAIAMIAAINAEANPKQFEPTITMWVKEEDFKGHPLTEVINEKHENPRYLPGINLGQNVHAEPDLEKAITDATAFVIVLPHQFVEKIMKQMAGKIRPDARAVTLIKGIHFQDNQIFPFASVIQKELNIPCSALCGANIANEVAAGSFSESTLGIPASGKERADSYAKLLERPEVRLWKTLFETPKFRIRVVEDVEGVCLCGALKNVVALAAGFIDGLEWGDNAKSAIMRIGLMEIHDFGREFFPSTKSATFLQESCGVADIMTSCMGGRNRKVAMEMVKSAKSYQELEKEMLNGQKLQGPETADQFRKFLVSRGIKEKEIGNKFPLFDNVWNICYGDMKPDQIISGL